MSNECIGVADKEGESMAQHLALAERELSAFLLRSTSCSVLSKRGRRETSG
jgi:hypothetical protein